MLKSYKTLCERLKINYKKDFSMLLIIVMMFIAIGVAAMLLYDKIIGFMLCFVGIGYAISHYSALKSRLKQLTYAKEIAFNAFYRYVITLLKNNHILYSALKESTLYIDEVLIDDVNELIEGIENDTTLNPFLKFMSNFDDENIKQMIILLYKTHEVGAISEVLDSINECMVNLQDTALQSYIRKEEKKIEKFYIFPILLSAVVMILVSFYVFSLIGEGLYV